MNKPDNISEDIWNELTTKEKEDRINGIDDMPPGVIDWNKLSLDMIVTYLENKYMFSSSADAHCIYRLIKFYKEHSK